MQKSKNQDDLSEKGKINREDQEEQNQKKKTNFEENYINIKNQGNFKEAEDLDSGEFNKDDNQDENQNNDSFMICGNCLYGNKLQMDKKKLKKFSCICEECEESSSKFYCINCEQNLCEKCDQKIHNKGKRAQHKKELIDLKTYFLVENLGFIDYEYFVQLQNYEEQFQQFLQYFDEKSKKNMLYVVIDKNNYQNVALNNNLETYLKTMPYIKYILKLNSDISDENISSIIKLKFGLKSIYFFHTSMIKSNDKLQGVKAIFKLFKETKEKDQILEEIKISEIDLTYNQKKIKQLEKEQEQQKQQEKQRKVNSDPRAKLTNLAGQLIDQMPQQNQQFLSQNTNNNSSSYNKQCQSQNQLFSPQNTTDNNTNNIRKSSTNRMNEGQIMNQNSTSSLQSGGVFDTEKIIPNSLEINQKNNNNNNYGQAKKSKEKFQFNDYDEDNYQSSSEDGNILKNIDNNDSSYFNNKSYIESNNNSQMNIGSKKSKKLKSNDNLQQEIGYNEDNYCNVQGYIKNKEGEEIKINKIHFSSNYNIEVTYNSHTDAMPFSIYQNNKLRDNSQNKQDIDNIENELKIYAQNGELLINKDEFIQNYQQKYDKTKEQVENYLQQATKEKIIHNTTRSFDNNTTIELISFYLNYLSLESLIWIIKSIYLDKMTPTEKLILSRMKECFALKMTTNSWKNILFLIQKPEYQQLEKLIVKEKQKDPLIGTDTTLILIESLEINYIGDDQGTIDYKSKQWEIFIDFINSYFETQFTNNQSQNSQLNSLNNSQILNNSIHNPNDSNLNNSAVLNSSNMNNASFSTAGKGKKKKKKKLSVAPNQRDQSFTSTELKTIPGGRYGCAQYIKYCGPKKLKALSLGKLSLFVQEAINKGIIWYYKTLLVKQVIKEEANSYIHTDNSALFTNEQINSSGIKSEYKQQKEQKIKKLQEALIEILKENLTGIALPQVPQHLKKRVSFKFNLQELGFPKLKNFIATVPEVQIKSPGTTNSYAILKNPEKYQTTVNNNNNNNINSNNNIQNMGQLNPNSIEFVPNNVYPNNINANNAQWNILNNKSNFANSKPSKSSSNFQQGCQNRNSIMKTMSNGSILNSIQIPQKQVQQQQLQQSQQQQQNNKQSSHLNEQFNPFINEQFGETKLSRDNLPQSYELYLQEIIMSIQQILRENQCSQGMRIDILYDNLNKKMNQKMDYTQFQCNSFQFFLCNFCAQELDLEYKDNTLYIYEKNHKFGNFVFPFQYGNNSSQQQNGIYKIASEDVKHNFQNNGLNLLQFQMVNQQNEQDIQGVNTNNNGNSHQNFSNQLQQLNPVQYQQFMFHQHKLLQNQNQNQNDGQIQNKKIIEQFKEQSNQLTEKINHLDQQQQNQQNKNIDENNENQKNNNNNSQQQQQWNLFGYGKNFKPQKTQTDCITTGELKSQQENNLLQSNNANQNFNNFNIQNQPNFSNFNLNFMNAQSGGVQLQKKNQSSQVQLQQVLQNIPQKTSSVQNNNQFYFPVQGEHMGQSIQLQNYPPGLDPFTNFANNNNLNQGNNNINQMNQNFVGQDQQQQSQSQPQQSQQKQQLSLPKSQKQQIAFQYSNSVQGPSNKNQDMGTFFNFPLNGNNNDNNNMNINNHLFKSVENQNTAQQSHNNQSQNNGNQNNNNHNNNNQNMNSSNTNNQHFNPNFISNSTNINNNNNNNNNNNINNITHNHKVPQFSPSNLNNISRVSCSESIFQGDQSQFFSIIHSRNESRLRNNNYNQEQESMMTVQDLMAQMNNYNNNTNMTNMTQNDDLSEILQDGRFNQFYSGLQQLGSQQNLTGQKNNQVSTPEQFQNK